MSDVILPEEIYANGLSAYQREDYAAAIASFRAATDAYLAVNDQLMAAEMHNNASVALLQAGDARAALEEVAGTPELFAEAGDLRRQGVAYGNQAAALHELKRYEEALEAYQRSADLFQQVGEDDLRLHAMRAMANLQLKMGRQYEAFGSLKFGLDGVEKPTLMQRFKRWLFNIPFRWLTK